MQGVQVWSLVKELRSLGPQNKTIKQKQHCDKFNTLKIVKKKKTTQRLFQSYPGSLRLGCPCSEPAPPGLLRLVWQRGKPEECCRWRCWSSWGPCSWPLTLFNLGKHLTLLQSWDTLPPPNPWDSAESPGHVHEMGKITLLFWCLVAVQFSSVA